MKITAGKATVQTTSRNKIEIDINDISVSDIAKSVFCEYEIREIIDALIQVGADPDEIIKVAKDYDDCSLSFAEIEQLCK